MSDLAVQLEAAPAVCQYDSGSATGCRPLCDAPPVWAVAYRNGSYPVTVTVVCERHRGATLGRLWPSPVHVTPLEGVR